MTPVRHQFSLAALLYCITVLCVLLGVSNWLAISPAVLVIAFAILLVARGLFREERLLVDLGSVLGLCFFGLFLPGGVPVLICFWAVYSVLSRSARRPPGSE